MDPLMMVIDEIVRLREDVTKLEQDISDCEVRIDFQPQDPRYIRLCTEKELVLKNLCDIRMELCQKAIDMQGNAIYARKEADGTVDYYTDKAPAPKLPPNTYTSSGHIPSSHTGMQITPPSPSHTHQYQGMYSVGGGSNSSGSAGYPVKVEPPSSKKIAPTDLPDLPRYLQAKATLSTIMRDFTDNKVHFVGLDGHVISMAEFQSISKFTKTGEDPSKFMQGSSDTYKTGYNKKTNTFTENTLFVPLCVPYQTSSSAAGSSSSVASSYNGTSVGSMRAY